MLISHEILLVGTYSRVAVWPKVRLSLFQDIVPAFFSQVRNSCLHASDGNQLQAVRGPSDLTHRAMILLLQAPI